MTIRTRLTIWYGLTLMLLIAIAGLVVWWQVEVSLRESLERELRIRAVDVAASLEEGDDELGLQAPDGLGIFTVLVDPASGRSLASPGAPQDLPELPAGPSQRTLTADGLDYVFYTTTLTDGRSLITGSSLAHVQVSAARVPELLVTVGILCAIASLVGGWWLAGRALGPIRRLTEEADAIGPHDLTQRLPVFRQQDEVGHLATTLNRLLARVEAGVRRERAFIAGAAHDLRTPIAALRVRLDGLTSDRAAGTSEHVSLEDVRQDVLNLGDLADALLGLAEAQAPGPADAVADHVLPLLVSRAEQEVEWLAHERNIHLVETIDEVSVRISAVRFHQALTNLLTNAVRHGPGDSSVRVEARLSPGPDGASHADGDHPGSETVLAVEVADEGPGIAPADQADLFVPFGIERHGSGTHGLGLATAAAAVRSQGGEIGYRDGADGGSIFWFRLPIAASGETTGHDRGVR
jgi:two-component system OmpR family sensor kinase